jgi:hypothetical protein
MNTKRVRADELKPGDVSHGITVETITPMLHVTYGTGASQYLRPNQPVTVDSPEPTVTDYRAAIADWLAGFGMPHELVQALRAHGIELDAPTQVDVPEPTAADYRAAIEEYLALPTVRTLRAVLRAHGIDR